VSTDEPLHIESIAQIHRMIDRPPPANPLLAVIAASWQEPLRITIPIIGRPIVSDLYAVSLKRGDECHLELGRQVYDGQAGSIAFLAPGQAMKPLAGSGVPAHDGEGWTLVFHPDLLHARPLAALMRQYRFFGYADREALHLTDSEREQLTAVVRRLDSESSTAPDWFAPEVLTSHLQVLFSYCQRSYGRQFQLRAQAEGSVAQRLDRHLDEHLAASPPPGGGLPTVRSCARALGYSPDYLSDLLRAETGMSAKDHIHRAVIEAAKARLLASATSASEVAYALGFEHPQHFSRLFRQKTGHSPGAWRKSYCGRKTKG
jgi:AraC family transcriptional regulator, transcriptional activator of pobA